jgi:hypothetical protein
MHSWRSEFESERGAATEASSSSCVKTSKLPPRENVKNDWSHWCQKGTTSTQMMEGVIVPELH